MLESGIAKQTIKEGVKKQTVGGAALKAGGISLWEKVLLVVLDHMVEVRQRRSYRRL